MGADVSIAWKSISRPIFAWLCVPVVMSAVTVSAAGASTRGQKPGIGWTVTAWKRVYGLSHGPGQLCSAKNSCFVPGLRNGDSGRTYQFTDVDVTRGIISGYQEDFPDNTTVAQAEAATQRTLPPDAQLGSIVIDTNGGSCGMLNVSSPTLIKELNTPKIGDTTGTVGIELQHIHSNLNSVYSPSNVQTATVSVVAADPTQSC